MKNSSFIQILRSEISNDELCDLLRTFEPLLKKYARLLEYPDAYFDLQAAFPDIVKKLDVNRLDNKTRDRADLSVKRPCRHPGRGRAVIH